MGDPNAQINGLLTGEIQGMYMPAPAGLARLRTAGSGTLYLGRSFTSYEMIANQDPSGGPNKGPAGDPRVRKALSLAINRQAIANTVLAGIAVPTLSPTMTASWTYGGTTFADAAKRVGEPRVDLEAAKALVAEAGKGAQPIILGYASRPDYAQLAAIIQDAGRRINLNIQLQSYTLDQWVAGLFDPSLRKFDLMFVTKNLNIPDPYDFYSSFTPPYAFNYGAYRNEFVTSTLEKARQTEDPMARAQLIVQAETQFVADQAWVPLVELSNTLYMDKSISGAPASFVFMFYPWAADLGSAH